MLSRVYKTRSVTIHDGAAVLERDKIRHTRLTHTSTEREFNGVCLSTSIIPAGRATRGGDWCETFVLGKHVVALSIGDVRGHGATVFATMARVRRFVRDAGRAGAAPDAILTAANRFVSDLDPDLHATALFALLDTQDRTLTFSNAGHPPPLVVDTATRTFLSYASSDPALGIDPIIVPALHREPMPAGGLLVLYTDGVTERDRDLLRGEHELADAAQRLLQSKSPSAAALSEALRLCGSNYDDAALLTATFAPRLRRWTKREAGAWQAARNAPLALFPDKSPSHTQRFD